MDELDKFNIPKDIQEKFSSVSTEEMFLHSWKNIKAEKFLRAVLEDGEELFWEKIRSCFMADDPEEALSLFQGEVPKALAYMVSALKRSVSFLKFQTKQQTEVVLKK